MAKLERIYLFLIDPCIRVESLVAYHFQGVPWSISNSIKCADWIGVSYRQGIQNKIPVGFESKLISRSFRNSVVRTLAESMSTASRSAASLHHPPIDIRYH